MKRPRRLDGLPNSNDSTNLEVRHEYLHERIRWLRQNMKPYMTQAQLAEMSGIYLARIAGYEQADPRFTKSMKIMHLLKIAQALECELIIKLKKVPRTGKRYAPTQEECRVLSPVLPVIPKRYRKISQAALAQVLKRKRSPRPKRLREQFSEQRRRSFDKKD